jgi:hypothetical protein
LSLRARARYLGVLVVGLCVAALTAGARRDSERAVGQLYRDAVRRWLLPSDLPTAVGALRVVPCAPAHFAGCDLVFSGLDSSVAGDVGT